MPVKKAAKNKNAASIRARKVFKAVVENGGKSVGAAMREAGYSDAYAKNPHKLTGSPVWGDLIDTYMPDEDVARLHRELRYAGKLQTFEFPLPKPKRKKVLVPQEGGGAIYNDSEEEEPEEKLPGMTAKDIRSIIESMPGCVLIRVVRMPFAQLAYYSSPDNTSRRHALTVAMKMRRRYDAPKEDDPMKRDQFENMSNQELADSIGKMRAFLTKQKPPKR